MSDFYIEMFHKYLGEGMTHAEARRQFDERSWAEAVREDLDHYGLEGPLFRLSIEANRDVSNEDAMVQATQLWLAGWSSENPSLRDVQVWQWYWRRPSRRPGKPGRLFLSTNQAYREMKREAARLYVPVVTEAMTPLEIKAKEFATRHHAAVGQLRRFSDEPYIKHPAAVVEIIRSVPHTVSMLCAGWLHDTVEDTKVTIDEVLREFGEEIAGYVAMVTKVSRHEDGNREVRLEIDHRHSEQASPGGQTIKLADVLHNTSDLLDSGDRLFAERQLREKGRLVQLLRNGDPSLWRRAQAQIDLALTRISQAEPAGD